MIDFYNKFRIYESDISSLRGEIEIRHNGISDGNYSITSEKVEVIASIPRELSAKDIRLIFFDAHNVNTSFDFMGKIINSNLQFDYFKFTVDSIKSPGLYFFFFEIRSEHRIYGFKTKDSSVCFSFDLPTENERFQITVTDEKDESEKIPGIIYHIFVDRFKRGQDTPLHKDAILVKDWYSDITEYPEYPGAYLKNNTFFGGNFYGITEKLEYLVSIGVSVIYLSPVFESKSNHKYDTGNYEKIDEGFGGEKAFEELIKKAHGVGIKIIVDGVFNHTGADSKYFNKYAEYESIGAYQSKDSPYYNWYRFIKYPNEYVSWWGIDILPRIFYDNSDAEKYFLSDGGIIDKWMKKGILGFRLDVADELSDSFIEKIRAKISKINKSALLYGEVWEDASNKVAYGVRKKYYLGNELSGVMNYPLREGIIEYIRDKKEKKLIYALKEVMMNMPKVIRNKAMNILGSHDTARIISALSEDDVNGKSNRELSNFKMCDKSYKVAKKRLTAAYTLMIAFPGVPTVYYGDEAGVEGYGDPFNRRTFPWDREDTELLWHYRKCGILRKTHDVFYDGDFRILHLDSDFFIFERKKEGEQFLVVYNNSSHKRKIEFSASVNEELTNTKESKFILLPENAYIFKAEKCKFKIWGC